MPIIEVSDLVKAYDDVDVVDGVSFSVEEGEIFGIVGPNGAGKTTTVECVEGLRRPDSGSIQVLGLDPIRDRYEVTQRLGAQLQESRLQDKIKVGESLGQRMIGIHIYDEHAAPLSALLHKLKSHGVMTRMLHAAIPQNQCPVAEGAAAPSIQNNLLVYGWLPLALRLLACY